jgi:hypothetical protein
LLKRNVEDERKHYNKVVTKHIKYLVKDYHLMSDKPDWLGDRALKSLVNPVF